MGGAAQPRHCTGTVCLGRHYDKMSLPELPTTVHTEFELKDVINIDDNKFTITFSMYLGVRWREPRMVNRDNSSR